MRAPFPYFGGKSRAAEDVWGALGQPDNYLEPFCGSAAVLLQRAGGGLGAETINDLDGWVTNVWRSIRLAPDAVAEHLDWPPSEIDLHARQAVLHHERDDFTAWLAGHPDHCDPIKAAWWIYAANWAIGAPLTHGGPWTIRQGKLTKGSPTSGISRSIPALSNARSVQQHTVASLEAISKRLRHVAIACGSWERILTPAIATRKAGTVGVFLDPPYSTGSDLYAEGSRDLAYDVHQWCTQAPTEWRIVLAGYHDDHDQLLELGWRKITTTAGGSGYGSIAVTTRERLWISPACQQLQPTLV